MRPGHSTRILKFSDLMKSTLLTGLSLLLAGFSAAAPTDRYTRIAWWREARFAAVWAVFAIAMPLQAVTLNVRDYGATGDDRTNNTAAFTRCIGAIIEAGGGRMFLPDGTYRGRITIPPVSKPIPSWITIEIVGESEPTPVFGTIGSFPLRKHGTIVTCLDTSGPAVISACPSDKALYGRFSAVNVVIRNLDIRTCDNPKIHGIDLGPALQCRLENVFIHTGIYNVQSSKPVHGTCGLVTPANNNAALTLLRNVTVTGYDTGILVHEHTHGDHIVLGSNIHGLKFAAANHASRFDRVSAMRNTHHVTVTGRHGFSIAQLNIENSGPGQTDAHNEWQKVVHDINDPENLGTGDINWWVVRGNVGTVDEFKVHGGTSIRPRRIGAAP